MVYNYGDSDEKASYDKIKDNYKESVKLMYLAKFVADDSFKSMGKPSKSSMVKWHKSIAAKSTDAKPVRRPARRHGANY